MKKKFLLFIFIFFSFIGVSNAWRDLDHNWTITSVYPQSILDNWWPWESYIINSCDNNNSIIWEQIFRQIPSFWLFFWEEDLILECWENEEIIEETWNELTTTFNNLAWSWVTETWEIATSEIWRTYIFFVWFLIFIVIISYMYLIIQTKKLDKIKNTFKMKKNIKASKAKYDRVFMTRKESFKAWNSWYFSRNKKTWKLTYRNFKR